MRTLKEKINLGGFKDCPGRNGKNLKNKILSINWRYLDVSVFKFYLILIQFSQMTFATKYAGDFEELGVSARAIGLGGAYVAVATDPSAIYYNPAGPVQSKTYSVLLMHAESFGGIVKNNYLGIVLPSQKQSFGLGILNNSIPAIKLTTLPDTTQPPSDSNQPIVYREVNATHWVFYLNFARQLNPLFQIGVNAKIIYQIYGVGSCFGMGIDLGVAYLPFDGLNLGFRVRNLTTSPLFWNTKTREFILPSAALGIARTFKFGKDHLLFSAQLENNTDAGLTKLQLIENIGLEYALKEILAARLGLYHRLIALGLGINYRRIFIDYAYQSAYFSQSKDLGSSQKISGGLRF